MRWNTKVKPVPTPLDFDLERQFWESMTLEGGPESAYPTASELPGSTSANMSESSHVLDIIYGSKDGQLWLPRVSTPARAKAQDYVRRADLVSLSLLSPAQKQRKVLSKGMVASPSPHDPSAAFPSFTAAMIGMDGHGNVAYPPSVKVALNVSRVEARARARDVSD
ncbi:hypothetical protein C0992_009791 [Termitomyces sp. T32_za158]|nr:hypothetical protein C0992_009791 [Termitomyces sp. T32_za158]